MKKLLVSLIVFAMAASAGAGLYITYSGPGDPIWVGIYAQDMPRDGWFAACILIADDPAIQYAAEWTGGNIVYKPPALSEAYTDYYGYEAGWGDIWNFYNYGTFGEVGANGLHVEFELDLINSVAYVIIELWDTGTWELLDELHMGWPPGIWVEPTELAFSCTQGDDNPPPQTLNISNDVFGMLFWEITEACAWLEATPTTGIVGYDVAGPNEVQVSVDISGLTPGVYNCDLTITDPIAQDVIVPVELQVLARPGDFDEDGEVDCDDLRVLALAFMSKSGDDNWNPDCDISDPNDEVIDGQDFGVFAMYWDRCGDPPPEPGMSYQIEDCDLAMKMAGPDKDALRFSATVQGNYILFEDMMEANCCATEVWLEMTVEDNLITLYELEYTPMPCHCICDFPVTATLGPFASGTYTLDVYEDWGGFIGSTIVTIE